MTTQSTSMNPIKSEGLPDLPYLASRESYAMHEVVSYARAHGLACYEAGRASHAAPSPSVDAVVGEAVTDDQIKQAAEKAELVWEQNGALFVSKREDCDTTPELLAFARSILALAASVASRAQSEWLPIETAPKAGHILLADAEFVGEGFWQEALDDGVDYMGSDAGFVDAHYRYFRCGRSFGSEAYRDTGLQPTHWQPLPTRPATPGETK